VNEDSGAGAIPPDFLSWALAYAELGLRVFPVNARKEPFGRLTPNGFKSATSDPTTIRYWWSEVPFADIAEALPAGVVVVDIDAKGDRRGSRDFERLEGRAPQAVETPIASTPSGGLHLRYRADKAYKNVARIQGAPGLDTRAEGGYVVLPGPGNGRHWLKKLTETPLAPAPAWLDVVAEDAGPKRTRRTPGKPATSKAKKAARAVLAGAPGNITEAPNGLQRDTLNREAFMVGLRVGRGELDRDIAYETLHAAGAQMADYDPRDPWTEKELKKKIDAGLDDGIAKAFDVMDPPGAEFDVAGPGGAEPGAGEGADPPPPNPEEPLNPSQDGKAVSSLPDGGKKFRMTMAGLFRRGDNGWEWISQPFEVLALARDASGSNWSKVVRFRHLDGVSHEVTISWASLHGEPGSAVGVLADQGMDIKCTMLARRAFIEYLGSVVVAARATIVPCTGWVDGRRAFVLPDEVIGVAFQERVVLAGKTRGAYEKRGTFEGWRRNVATPAGEHRLVRFALSAAFAGTLLVFGGFESGIFHLFGGSTEGKTTCVRLAASVWGSPADGGYMRTWRATANGLEGALAGTCDTLLPLDEVGQANSHEIGATVYMVTGGAGKLRMRRDTSLQALHKWRALLLSSGEKSLEVRLNEDPRRSRAHAGQLVRAIDLAVGQVFDGFDGNPRAVAERLFNAALADYGAAGPEFVRRLLERQVDEDAVRERVAAFAEDVLKGAVAAHGQATRVASRFGLVAVAGELAVELGVLPWRKGDPTDDATTLFVAWLEEHGGGAYEARQMLAKVRLFAGAHGDSRFEDPDADLQQRPVTNRAGWRRGKGAARRWYVLPEVFRQEICAGFPPAEVVRVLADCGALEKNAKGEAARVIRLPGMEPQRLYVLTPTVFEGGDEEEEGK
jgi:uncharacterized protein (DUF927 family)